MPETPIIEGTPPTRLVKISITTHADAEIFLIGNDRQLVARAVGKLHTVKPAGIYRLKVTRAAAAAEKLIDVDDDFDETITVEGMDTIVPFERTLSPADRTAIDRVTAACRQSAIMILGRITAATDDHAGWLSVQISPWLSPVSVAPQASVETLTDGTQWLAFGAEAGPGTHVVEIDDGVRTMRHAVLVLDGWQTRIFIRRQLPSPASELSPAAIAGATDISVHLSRHNAPIALEQVYEFSEIARWSLAMERTALSNAQVINIFLDEKFFDPMAGIAAAHLMFDGVEKIDKSRDGSATPATYDPPTVMKNLTHLLGVQAASSPDLIALRLRAGDSSLTELEKEITAPPVYAKSWAHLLKASTGENPAIKLTPEVFKECAANYSCGPYFAWSPVNIATFVEQVIASNLPVLAARAVQQLSQRPESDDEDPSNETSTPPQVRDGGTFRRLRDRLRGTRAMQDLAGRLSGIDLEGFQTPRDLADHIAESVKPVARDIVRSVRERAASRAAELAEAILSNDELRAAFADNIKIPRSVVNDLFRRPPPDPVGQGEAPAESTPAEVIALGPANVPRPSTGPASAAAPSTALTQAQVDSCARLTWKNAGDVESFFAASGGFFKWYNARLSRHPAFQHRGAISITPERLARFTTFWNQIPDVFGRAQISGLEFAALMSVSVQETNGNLWASPEKVGTAAHPGISYAFDAIPGLKSSYNKNPGLGNKTARELFSDAHYVAAHRALPGFVAVTSAGVDPKWGDSQWPAAFGAAHFKKEDEARNGFIMQADFYKFRGRGVIQTTGRGGYKALIEFILTSASAAANPVLLALRNTWLALPGAAGPGRLDVIASCSTNRQWLDAFGQAAVLAAGVNLDSKRKRDYLDIGRSAAIVNAGTSTKGSFLFMARKINAGHYPATVGPMMTAMAEAVAELAQAAGGELELAVPMRAGRRAAAKKKAGARKAAKKTAKRVRKKKKVAKKTVKKTARKATRTTRKRAAPKLRKKQARKSAKRRGRR